jgi:hypothetical protein
LLLDEQWGGPVAGRLEQSGAKLYRHAVRHEILDWLSNMEDEQT